MPQHKRLSLAEIAKQDQVPVSPPAQMETPREVRTPRTQAAPESRRAPDTSEKRNRKSDFVKISVTLPPDMHETLQELSHTRRKRREPHMISDLVREALAGWLPKHNR